jgi:type VI secretion system secreted protein VgrG
VQEPRGYKYTFSTGDMVLVVDSFDVEEQISEAYIVTVNLICEQWIPSETVIQEEASLKIANKRGDRFFHGIINNFSFTGVDGRFYSYRATLVPSIWLLSLNQNFRIFQNMSAVEIVEQLLYENDISSDNYEFKLEFECETRRYCTQYNESTFDFICRILEEESIFFFFEHHNDSHVIVFSDTETAYTLIGGESCIGFNYGSGMVAEKETIQTFAHNRTVCPHKVTHRNYNFKRPSLDIQATEEGETDQGYEVYEYPGNFGLPTEGAPKVKMHLEELQSFAQSVQGTSNVSRFIPGYTFTVSNNTFPTLNDKYCIVSVEHEGSQSTAHGEYSGIGGDYTYSNHFVAIPASKAYRTRKTYQKPFVPGLQTAIVTGPEAAEIHADEYGRIKVQFHWDREGKNDDKASCWLRICQPWSGKGYGFAALPRVGDEVVVAFLNGDPDWPIVVGSVNNASSPALYRLPYNKTQSGIKTRSTPGGGPDNFNELRFEDKKGAEEVYLQSERDWNILVKNKKSETVRADSSTTIGGNSTVTVQNSSTETAKEISLTATSRITLNCGGSTIVLDPSGIQINGAIVKVNC